MARLDPLIKVQRHVVDEKRRALATLLREVEGLQAKKDQMLMNLAREAALAEATGDPRMISDYNRFAHASRVQMAALDVAMGKLQVRVAIAQEDIRAAFADLKKTEITDRERKTRAQREVVRKEIAEFDAIGVEGFRRHAESMAEEEKVSQE